MTRPDLHVRVRVCVCLFAVTLFNPCVAADGPQPELVSEFARLYVGLCMKNLSNLDGLRAQLAEKKLPQLSPDKAAGFLNGREGDAWPVPSNGQLGNYVLVLFTHASLCAIYGRRVNTSEVESDFDNLMSHVSAPMQSKLESDQVKDSAQGPVHTKGYTWTVIGHPEIARGMHFVLSTATSVNASFQAFGTASVGPLPP
jgi:hypothetical protein